MSTLIIFLAARAAMTFSDENREVWRWAEDEIAQAPLVVNGLVVGLCSLFRVTQPWPGAFQRAFP